MNRKLLVSLLRKNIEELNMITDGFMEMEEYPSAIIQLAKRKTEDIQTIIYELGIIKTAQEQSVKVDIEKETLNPEPVQTPVAVSIPVVEEMELKVEILEVVDDINEDPKPEIIEEITQSTIVQTTEVETSVEQIIELEEVNSVLETTFTTETTVTETKTHSEEVKKVTIADRMAHQSTSRNEMLSHKDNSLSATIANKKITDIKQAISIGDRFRFQRELFKSNGEDMNKTLSYINQLATLDEAMSFLSSKYNWADSNEALDDFLQIVKRKFA